MITCKVCKQPSEKKFLIVSAPLVKPLEVCLKCSQLWENGEFAEFDRRYLADKEDVFPSNQALTQKTGGKDGKRRIT